MRLKQWEVEDLGPSFKRMLASIQLGIKEAPPNLAFKLDGPRMLSALPRKGGIGATRGDHPFNGDEPFRPAELVVEQFDYMDEVLISIVMVPVAMKMAATVQNVRLPLDKAFEAFTGLEEWVGHIQPELRQPDPVGVPAGPVVTKEEFQSQETWGAW